LFCLAHAGGAATVFHSWWRSLPEDVEVCAVALAGRGARLREPPRRSVPELVVEIGAAVEPLLDRPYLVFGHSFGAVLGFELVRWLRRRGRPQPDQLVVSGSAAPDRKRPPRGHLPDKEFVAYLRTLGGMPGALFDDPEVLDMMLPSLRADFEALESYEHAVEPPLDCALTAAAGSTDPRASLADLEEWIRHTSGSFRTAPFTGGHFYLLEGEGRARLLALLALALGDSAPGGAGDTAR
jgi:surfactin synthase thioesterase subunit